MADTKISALTELATTPASTDEFIVYDDDAAVAKAVTFANVTSGKITTLGSTSVEELSDVASMTPAEGDILAYNGSTWTNVALIGGGEQDFVASGAISTGDRVALQAAGTVTTVVAADIAVGTQYEVYDNNPSAMAVTYDTANDKIVIAYVDVSGNGYAVVGTVSAGVISYGTPVSWLASNATTALDIVFDTNAGKVLIVYKNTSDTYGYAIVGTVSGTSISFGTATVFNSGKAVSLLRAVYDSTAQKVVINIRQSTDNYGSAVVATISGTSVSFGSVVNYETAGDVSSIDICYDDNNDSSLFVYRDTGNSNYGTAIVGTVSGTSISFGTNVVFESADSIRFGCAFSSVSNKCLVVYNDGGNSNYATAIVGTMSGTSVSFGTTDAETNYETGYSHRVSVHPTSGVFVVLGRNQSGATSGQCDYTEVTVSGTTPSFSGTMTVVHTGDATTNQDIVYDPDGATFFGIYEITNTTGESNLITPEIPTNNTDYIGIAKENISDTATGTIFVYPGISPDQSSLTPGSTYYVNEDGTLTTTDTGVRAGKALSATELLINP